MEHGYGFTTENGEQFDPVESGNKIIYGDNLEALKSLLPFYEGKVDCIYIDPPYNTGEEGWVYNDNVNHPKIKKWLGQVVGKQSEDLSRHDKWLCMMYPRLQLLKQLLSDTGVIFISIDDNEQANLKLICDEIFGLKAFITTIHCQMSTTQGMKVKSAQNGNIVKNAEYILCYSKDGHKNIAKNPLYDLRPEYDEHYSLYLNEDGTIGQLKDIYDYRFPKDLNNKKALTLKEAFLKSNEFAEVVKSNLSNIVADDKVTGFDDEYSNLENGKWIEVERNGKNYVLTMNSNGNIRQLLRLKNSWGKTDNFNQDVGLRKIRGDWWEGFYIDMGNVSKEADTVFANGKKPVRLISQLLNMSSNRDSIILDSFAGSGTTAHAVLNINKQDGGNRKFILIELEDYANDITAERVKRVIRGYGNGKNAIAGTGGDFNFYTLGQSLLDDERNLNIEMPMDAVCSYIWYTETHTAYEKGEQSLPLLGVYENTAYYLNYIPNEVTTLDRQFLKNIDVKANQYVIYADNCLLPKELMQKYNIIFKKIPRDISQF
ncbi:DNA (cytosine-5-)-methyltransferase [Enhydrobacter aerosaccus SK60]|nr:DNA (cytosine-5-)-methyltransferase [Enhydrobacter aerosaccus SK60]